MLKDSKCTKLTGVSVMYVIPTMISGGIEKNVVEVANYLVSEGVIVYILTTEVWMLSMLDPAIKVIYHDVKTKNIFKMISNSFTIKNLCRKYSIDIIHVKSRAPAWSVWLASRTIAVRTVSTIHGIYNLKTKVKRFYAKPMMSMDAVIAVSQVVADYVMNNYDVPLQKLYTITRGIDFTFYSQAAINKSRLADAMKSLGITYLDKKIILFPGRLSHIKGQELLLEALRGIEDRRNFLCIIVGDISKNPKLRNLLYNKILQYQLEGCVMMIDNMTDIRAAYMLAHVVLCLSTKPESFGRIPIEAGAMCRPSIVSDIGGLSQSIIPNKTGWFVQPGSVSDIIEKINYAISLPREEWEQYCRNAREYTQEYFNIEVMFEKTKRVYLDLLVGRR